jgi:hypothetical protein
LYTTHYNIQHIELWLKITLKTNNTFCPTQQYEVEHVISGVKCCRIVKDVLRLIKKGIPDVIMEVAGGLHNLRVSCRRSLEAFDLLVSLDLFKTYNA